MLQITKIIFTVTTIGLALGQDDIVDSINQIFTRNNTADFLDNYEEVSPPPLETLGALVKCGEGEFRDRLVCVPYYNCDPATNTVKESGVTGGTNVIDVRYGENQKCDHYLDVCCQTSNATSPTDPGSTERPRLPTRRTTTTTPTPDSLPDRPTSIPTRRPSTTTQGTIQERDRSYCGIRNTQGIDFKIADVANNGEAEYGEFPWMVAILNKNGASANSAICGGSLITPLVVLTGAHCVRSIQREDIKVRAGEWDTQTTKERIPFQERDVFRIIPHEHFLPMTLQNDIALLVLDRPFSRAESVGTICLPPQNQKFSARNCFATGWGKDIFGLEGRYSVILKKIQLPVVQHPNCQRSLRTTRLGASFNLHRSFICAGGELGVDACTGDGGSPLVCPDPSNSNRYMQTGIVAWGIGCGEARIPGVYTDVAQFRTWIDKKLDEININKDPYSL